MRRGACARAATLVGLTLAGYLTSPGLTGGLTGIASAEAAQFYTRKRVNGRWITGMFPKGQASARRIPARAVSIRLTTLPAPIVVVPPPRFDAGLPAAAFVSEADETTVTSGIQPAVAALEVHPVQPEDERLRKLRRALEARADEIAATQHAAAASSDAALPILSVRPALSDRAVALPPSVAPAEATFSTTSSSKEAQRSGPSPAAKGGALEPKSVSYDFETGIKTIVYESSVVREPFDVAAMRSMAGRLPLASGR